MGKVLYIRLLIYAGLSLFIKSGPYVYMVVCVVYVYNLTFAHKRKFLLCSTQISLEFISITFEKYLSKLN